MKLRPFYQSHGDLYNDTKLEGEKQQIHEIHHMRYIDILSELSVEPVGGEE